MSLHKKLDPSHFIAVILIAAAISNAAALANDYVAEPPLHFRRAISVYPRVYTNVYNWMPNRSTMKAWCRSKDNDIGLQNVAAHVAYTWSFHPNWAGSTLFSCVVKGTYGRIGFNAYDFERDQPDGRCVSECRWNATRDGVHGFNQATGAYDIFHPWAF